MGALGYITLAPPAGSAFGVRAGPEDIASSDRSLFSSVVRKPLQLEFTQCTARHGTSAHCLSQDTVQTLLSKSSRESRSYGTLRFLLEGDCDGLEMTNR